MNRLAQRLCGWSAAIERAAAETVSAAALRGAERAKQLAPVDRGTLREGIGARMDGLQAEVISAAAHSAMVEFGTSRAPAQPFMQPTAQEMRVEFASEMEKAVREVLK